MRKFGLVQWSSGILRRLSQRRPRRRPSRDWSACWAAVQVLEIRTLLSSQVLTPVVEASIEDSNLNGQGDFFNSPPFTGVLRQLTNLEDRAVSEFNVAGYSGIDSAVLNFNLAVNNYFGGPTRTFDVSLYSGNGQADLTDFSVSATRVGTVTLVVANSNTDYQLNVTGAVQSLKAGGATHIGVRIDPVDNSSPSIYRYSKLTVDGTPVVTNNPPSIAAQSFSIDENSPNGTVIGLVQATEPDAGQSLSYSITAGNELGLFAIDASNGSLSVADGSRLDYETALAHNLTVAVTDNGTPALSASAAIRVNLLDQNDNPPVIGAGQTFMVPEDAANDTVVGTVQVSDRDTVGGARTFSIVGGNDAGIFAVNAATGQITVADNTNLNYDLAQTHLLSTQVSDGVNLSAVQTVRINVEPLPFATTLPPVVRASIHDQPRNGTGDSFNASPFEGLLRQVEDISSSQEDRAVVEFNLTNLGAVKGSTLDLQLAVNNSFGGGTRTFAVLVYGGNGQADLSDFSVSATQVAQVDLVVSQQSGSYHIDVASQVQQVLLSGTKWVGVRVDPVNNSAPSILVSATLTVNAAPTLNPVPQALTIAEDAGPQVLNLSGITAGGREDQPLRVTAVSNNQALIPNPTVVYSSPDRTGRIEFAPNHDANGSATITVTVTDAGIDQAFGTADDNTIVGHTFIAVTPVNDPPVVANQSFSLAENSPAGTAVGTATASDPENQGVTWSIVSGNTGNAFALNTNTGAITVANAAALDFESGPVFQITVQATDKGSPQLSANGVITINLTDVNDPPIVAGPSFSLAENSFAGTAVGAISASDPENQGVTWAITSGNIGGAFAIDADTGAIAVASAAALDYETTPLFSLTVQAADKGSPQQTATAVVTISLTDVNEPPIVAGQTFSLAENSLAGTAVGTATASDPENQGVTWSIVSGNTGVAFAIDADTGAITVANPAALDYETTPLFNLTVRAADKGSPQQTATAVVAISLTDVNDPPFVAGKAFSLAENRPAGAAVGTVTASDPENQGVTWSIVSGNTGGAFAINSNTGAITVANSAALDYETTPLFNLTVRAADKGSPQQTATAAVTISLTNVNEPPIVASLTFSLAENSPAGTAVGTATASDPENQGVTWSIVSGNTGGAFAINANTGAITVANAAMMDFETTPQFKLTVRAADKGSPQASSTAVVTINLFDAPLSVGLDVVPGDSTNTIDLRLTSIEVAVLSTSKFDARQVDVNSLRFGATGFEDSLVRNRHGVPTYRYADLNGDGRLDLVATFDVALTGLKVGDTVGILRGFLLDGDEIVGTQTIRVISTRGGPKK